MNAVSVPVQVSVAVLEDDVALREDILVPQLDAIGFNVEGFGTSAQLYERMKAISFELLVLDLRLENEDGLDIARHLRATSPIGIVTLTGLGSQAERIRGLMESVDAWLAKPVEIEVLAATLHSLARRMRLASNDGAFPSTGWRLLGGNWRLHSPNGGSIPLNLLERRMLTRLFATPGELVTHDDLIADLSAVAENFDRHRLEILIHRLRRKVADRLGTSLPLRALRGFGYLILTVDERAHER